MEVNPGAHGEIHLCRRAELDEPRQAHQIEDMWKEKLSFGLSSSYVKASLTHPNSRGGGVGRLPGSLRASSLAARMDEHSVLCLHFLCPHRPLSDTKYVVNAHGDTKDGQSLPFTFLPVSGRVPTTTVKSIGFSVVFPTATGKNLPENSEELLLLTWDPSFLPGTESWPWMTIGQGSLEK